ncbi:MAG TPA: BlaI/MecI/CopY family transcriptional regulator [Vicinamibacterales bacterium]|nr:BlaI/MecI/CopY family transcriptional regulator [Vicinamibacterales bacterium]
MSGGSPLPGADLELAVLEALWDLGRASARDLHDRVGGPRGLVYTTTTKVLDRLQAKGLVTRRRDGRRFLYLPRRRRETVERARVRDALARLLRPAPRPVMATLVDAVESLDPDLLEELSRLVQAKRRQRRGP